MFKFDKPRLIHALKAFVVMAAILSGRFLGLILSVYVIYLMFQKFGFLVIPILIVMVISGAFAVDQWNQHKR